MLNELNDVFIILGSNTGAPSPVFRAINDSRGGLLWNPSNFICFNLSICIFIDKSNSKKRSYCHWNDINGCGYAFGRRIPCFLTGIPIDFHFYWALCSRSQCRPCINSGSTRDAVIYRRKLRRSIWVKISWKSNFWAIYWIPIDRRSTRTFAFWIPLRILRVWINTKYFRLISYHIHDNLLFYLWKPTNVFKIRILN